MTGPLAESFRSHREGCLSSKKGQSGDSERRYKEEVPAAD